MPTKKVKQKEHENLSDTYISRVIGLLTQEKPITKKAACAILNISYNTTRLDSIIKEWKERKALESKRRAEKRGTPLSEQDLSLIVEYRLKGEPISSIAKLLYRSTNSINKALFDIGVPEKSVGEDKHITKLLPEQCIAEDFDPKEIVWSAKHNCTCEVVSRLPDSYIKDYGVPCYKVWVKEKSRELDNFFVDNGGYYAYIEAYDLGKLNHLDRFGINKKEL